MKITSICLLVTFLMFGINVADIFAEQKANTNTDIPEPYDNSSSTTSSNTTGGDIFGGTDSSSNTPSNSDNSSNPFIGDNYTTPPDTDTGDMYTNNGGTITGSNSTTQSINPFFSSLIGGNDIGPATDIDSYLSPEYNLVVVLTPGKWREVEISLSELGNRESVIISPIFSATNLEVPGNYRYYAAFVENSDIYMARKDRLGNFVFIEKHPSDTYQNYETRFINNENPTFACNVFEELLETLKFTPAYLAENPIFFLFCLAPPDSFDSSRIQGAIISVVP